MTISIEGTFFHLSVTYITKRDVGSSKWNHWRDLSTNVCFHFSCGLRESYVPVLTLPHTHVVQFLRREHVWSCVLGVTHTCFIGRCCPRHPRISRRSHYPRSYLLHSSCILTDHYLTGMTFSVTICVVNHDTSHELCSNINYVLVIDTHNNSVMSGQITYRFIIQSIVVIVYVELGASSLMTIIFKEFLN